jgi:AmmeMemoRadiSam system protein B
MSDRPRLRPLQPFPIVENGQRFLGLRDPSGLTDAVARLPAALVAVVQLCDGERTRDEICDEFARRYQSKLPREALDHFLEQLDQALLLDSERFQRHAAELLDAFDQAEIRPAHLAGRSYPPDADELSTLLDGFFHAPDGPGQPGPRTGALPRAIVAPHIDFHRGGPAYAHAYRVLAEAAEAPELVVVFGTDHQGAEHPFTLTRKHYDTPLGRIDTDRALVDELASSVRRRLGATAADRLFAGERNHRGEHSIEFQAVWLRHVLGARADEVKLLPILCGSLHHLVESGRAPHSDAAVSVFLDEVKRLTDGRRTLFVAGADLAHVGPHFGDADPLDDGDKRGLRHRDEASLAHCARGDAAGWFAEIASEKDRRRVCGLPPIYALLATADVKRERSGRVTFYGQCAADEDAGSLVSIASVVYDV